MWIRVCLLAGLVLALLPVLEGRQAAAASFDCRAAESPAEITICDSRSLRRLDTILGDLYASVMDVAEGAMARRIRTEQRNWLASREVCEYDLTCIRAHYEGRIRELRNWADRLDIVDGD